jgi:hypothetical protein
MDIYDPGLAGKYPNQEILKNQEIFGGNIKYFQFALINNLSYFDNIFQLPIKK